MFDNLKPNQLQAAILLAQGMQCKTVAAEVNVTPQTISEWKQVPEFEAVSNYLRWETLEAARDRMRALAPLAVNTLEDVMENGENEMARIKAAQMVFETIGMTDPATGLWGWGIGSVDPEVIAKESDQKYEVCNESKH